MNRATVSSAAESRHEWSSDQVDARIAATHADAVGFALIFADVDCATALPWGTKSLRNDGATDYCDDQQQ